MTADTGAKIKVGILSLGDMGAGIARLLVARGFLVATNCEGQERAREAGVETLSTDGDLVRQCAVILSVVPPRDAEATAWRVADALAAAPGGEPGGEAGGEPRGEAGGKQPVYYLDLNAVSPATSRGLAALLEGAAAPVRFIDGCILGGPPPPRPASAPGPDPASELFGAADADAGWTRPSVPVSGPHSLAALPGGDRLASALNLRAISPDVSAASGLKMCFAAVAKGFTALVTQSFATAHRLGVAGELRRELGLVMPRHLASAERGIPDMPPKAYRWVGEMEEIAATVSAEGGWRGDMFRGAAGVYRAVADDEVLGREKVGKRKRGTTLGDVAAAMAEGLQRKQHKTAASEAEPTLPP